MYHSQSAWRELYNALHDYDGADAYADLLAPWPADHPEERRFLAEVSRASAEPDVLDDEALCRLYGASRVTTVLLLRFQQGEVDGSAWRGPPITLEGFRRFHEALGMRVPEAPRFHPFFHEIVGVRQAARAESPIELVERLWPPLMLGDLMYSRGGCVVAGGSDHIVKDIAENSTLYWAYRRKHRPHEDASHDWGSNSQWRTRLRRDYQTATGYSYNVDAEESLNGASGIIEGVDAVARVEMTRHRCLIRSVIDVLDPYPYCYSYEEEDDADSGGWR